MSIIYFSNVRCSFPNLTAPYVSRKFPTAPANFTIDLVNIDPQDPKIADFFKDYAAQAQATWGATAPQIMQMIKADKRSRSFGMGSEKINEETFKPLDGYGEGVWINCKNKNQPQMIRPDGSPAANQIEAMELARKIYGGCYVNVAISPWLRLANKGVSCNLIAVQFAKDGEAFGSSTPDVAPMFGAVLGNAPTGGFAPAGAVPAMPGLPSFL
jgi:hypothetical protein